MSKASDEKRERLLGMPKGKAHHILHTDIMFALATKDNPDCHRCGKPLSRDNFSIEHKEAWMQSDDPVKSFFDLENIGFSHKRCNYGLRSTKIAEHGTVTKYTHGCRCEECKLAYSVRSAKYRSPEKRREKYLRLGT